jgi:hypothetical protein
MRTKERRMGKSPEGIAFDRKAAKRIRIGGPRLVTEKAGRFKGNLAKMANPGPTRKAAFAAAGHAG